MSLVPGLRVARVPFATGVLASIAMCMSLLINGAVTASEIRTLLLEIGPSGAGSAAITICVGLLVYVFGVLVQAVCEPLTRAAALVATSTLPARWFTPRWESTDQAWTGLRTRSATRFALDVIASSVDLRSAVDEADRTRSEGEFRLATAIPASLVIILSPQLFASSPQPIWIVMASGGALAAFLYLAVAGHAHVRNADTLLSRAESLRHALSADARNVENQRNQGNRPWL